jgi:uncharacterized protein (DUF4415 family)
MHTGKIHVAGIRAAMAKPSVPRPPRKPARAPEAESPPRSKTRLTMYLDTAVVEHFRLRSGGRGYQTLINEALRQAMEREDLEDVLRRVIREEARPYKPGKG